MLLLGSVLQQLLIIKKKELLEKLNKENAASHHLLRERQSHAIRDQSICFAKSEVKTALLCTNEYNLPMQQVLE